MRALTTLLVGAIALIVSGALPASAQPAIKIRVSWVAPVSNWGAIMLEKKELAQHLGKSYTMEAVRYAGTPPMVTAEVVDTLYCDLRTAIAGVVLLHSCAQ